jgi:hypothetical protein
MGPAVEPTEPKLVQILPVQASSNGTTGGTAERQEDRDAAASDQFSE